MRLGCLALAACRVARLGCLGLQRGLATAAPARGSDSSWFREAVPRPRAAVRASPLRALVVRREMALTLPLCAAASHPPTSRRVAAQGSEHKSPRRHPE